jgi:hypothetical protein
MVQAAVLDGLFLDLFSPFDDGGVTPEVAHGLTYCWPDARSYYTLI